MITISHNQDKLSVNINGKKIHPLDINYENNHWHISAISDVKFKEIENFNTQDFPENFDIEVSISDSFHNDLSFVSIFRKNNLFTILLKCSIHPMDWNHQWNLNSYFNTIKSICINELNNQLEFIDETDEAFNIYHYTLKYKTDIQGKLKELVLPGISLLHEIHNRACKKLGANSQERDLIEIKPGIFGISLNVNELLKRMLKIYKNKD